METQKVQCPECAAEVSALREFCPHCGTATNPGLKGRLSAASGERSPEELQRNRKTVLIIGGVILFLGVLAGKSSMIGGAFGFHPQHRETGPVVIEAQQVYDAYRNDSHSAKRRFRHREMVVSGEFVRIVPDGQGNPDLRLKTSDPEAPLGADLVQMSYEQAARLTPGQRVTVSCQRITGSGDDRWLQNCAIQGGAGSKAAVPAPSPAGGQSSPAEGNHG